MLTNRQYEAIGRLALAINEIESIIDLYAWFVIGVRELGVADVLTDEGTFSRKVERFKKILQAILDSHVEVKPHIDSILALMPNIKRVIDQRNKYVHAQLFIDSDGIPRLKSREQTIDCDEETIMTCSREANMLAIDLFRACEVLIKPLTIARGDDPIS